ncbi:hypothetical protein REPUB_Repub06bG0132200 [Reevesia pubescens]
MEAVNADANPSNVQVQHVTKRSSDELLRKFAELEDDDDKASARKELRVVVKRRKNNGWATRRRESVATRQSTLVRQLGIGRSTQLRARGIRNRSLFGTIEKVRV